MDLQAKNIKEYKQASEVLYALNAVRMYSSKPVSKISLQKIIYLSVLFSPIKEIILSFLKYNYNYRGPWSSDLQNIIDHLVGQDYANITDYELISERSTLINYSITQRGVETIASLTGYDIEDEKCWWITTISRLAINYTMEHFNSKYKGLDQIVEFVYQDPTYLEGKSPDNFRKPIDFKGENDVSFQLIQFSKDYLNEKRDLIGNLDERRIAEILLVAFFEYLHVKLINKEYGN